MSKLRLDKIISSSAFVSRREAAEMIRRGAVTVDGAVPASGAEKYDPAVSLILINGIPADYREHRYIMMNKPAGVLSATEDLRDRTVADLLREPYSKMGLFPAGRLDKDAEGLMLLTDDGDFAHRVISPGKKVFKRYYAEVSGILTESDKAAVEAGIELNDMVCLPGRLEIAGPEQCYIEICEGKFHQVKRMLGSLGKPVKYLKRVSIGGLRLPEQMKPGEYREMSPEEANLVFQDREK